MPILVVVTLSACEQQRSVLREIEKVRSRSVPSDASLLHASEPVRYESSVRATWEISTRSDVQTYFDWLGSQLEPEYRRASRTGSGVSFVKEVEGDSYTVSFRSAGPSSGSLFKAEFIAAPD